MAAHGFQWWKLLHNEYLDHNGQVAAASVAVTILAVSAVAYAVVAPKLTAETKNDEDFIPPATLGLRNIFELIGEFVQGMAHDIIGHHYKSYLPLLIFIFIWTLLNNLLGMVPGFGSATDNLNTTLAMGFFVYFYYNFQGFRSHGFKYMEHFTGHLSGVLLLVLGPVMFVIELVSHTVRPITLGIRLRSNIYGDHTIYGIMANLFKDLGEFLGHKFGPAGTALGAVFAALGPVPIVVLGLLVAVIQAFVFMLLTTIYIGMATAHDEH